MDLCAEAGQNSLGFSFLGSGLDCQLMQLSEGDPIDLCSDGEAAIAPQPKRRPQEHFVNVYFHPSLFTPGTYHSHLNRNHSHLIWVVLSKESVTKAQIFQEGDLLWRQLEH